jgi:hypothetical protein
MSDAVLVALIMGGSSLLPALLTLLLAAFSAHRASLAARLAEEVKKVSNETSHRIDGRMDELLELTRTAARAAGMLEQKNIHESNLPATVKRQEEEEERK